MVMQLPRYSGNMNKKVASSMKDNADAIFTYDDGNEYMFSESVVMAKDGAAYVSFKDAIKLHKKMRNVHECTNLVDVEDIVDRSFFQE
eukprot:1404512-Ditylum_brightwellii.AAC.1